MVKIGRSSGVVVVLELAAGSAEQLHVGGFLGPFSTAR